MSVSILDPDARRKLMALASSNPILAKFGPGADGVTCAECRHLKLRQVGPSWLCRLANSPRGVWEHHPDMQSCARHERRAGA